MLSFPHVKPDMRKIHRILIVKLSALGDVLHALPAVAYLRRVAPGLEVHWAVDASFAELLRGDPGIAKVVPLPIREWKGRAGSPGTWREALDAARALRRERYDAAIDIQGNLKSGLVTRLSGAPLRVGFDRDGVRESLNLLFTNRRVKLLPEDRHISWKYLRVVGDLFGRPFETADLAPSLAIPRGDRDAAASLVNLLLRDASPRMALHPGSSWPTKKMAPEFWAEAIRRLREIRPGLGVLVSWGSGEERREAQEIRAKAGGTVEVLPRLPLMTLAAVYRECGFVMAPDTGPLHLAAAGGAGTVSVFRATDGGRNAPAGPAHRFLQAPMACRACLRRACDRDAECRASVSPGEAASLMSELMGT
jgi:heptosyltransferase-1